MHAEAKKFPSTTLPAFPFPIFCSHNPNLIKPNPHDHFGKSSSPHAQGFNWRKAQNFAASLSVLILKKARGAKCSMQHRGVVASAQGARTIFDIAPKQHVLVIYCVIFTNKLSNRGLGVQLQIANKSTKLPMEHPSAPSVTRHSSCYD